MYYLLHQCFQPEGLYLFQNLGGQSISEWLIHAQATPAQIAAERKVAELHGKLHSHESKISQLHDELSRLRSLSHSTEVCLLTAQTFCISSIIFPASKKSLPILQWGHKRGAQVQWALITKQAPYCDKWWSCLILLIKGNFKVLWGTSLSAVLPGWDRYILCCIYLDSQFNPQKWWQNSC